MSRAFPTLDAFVSHLATLPRAVREAQRRGAEAAGAELERHAKALVGTYDAQPRWPELAESTKADRVRRGFSANEPELRTGSLRNSIGHRADDHGVTLGSTSPIAPYQEHGTSSIPPRPFISATMFQHGHAAADTIARHVVGALAGQRGPVRR